MYRGAFAGRQKLPAEPENRSLPSHVGVIRDISWGMGTAAAVPTNYMFITFRQVI